MTSRAVYSRIELSVTKTFMPGLASPAFHSNNFTQGFFVKNIHIVIRQKVHRHTFIQVDLWPFIFPRWRPFSKMAATMVGTINFIVKHIHTTPSHIANVIMM